jgi:cytochrome c oxidase subunit 2
VALLLWAVPAIAAEHPLGQPYDGEIELQPAAAASKQMMIDFHDGVIMPIITVISALVMFLLLYVMIRFNAKANPKPSTTVHNTQLEIAWTVVPSLIVLFLMLKSMPILYFADHTENAEMTLKVTGYQWYWGYEYPDHGGVSFLSNLVQDKDLKPGQPRLLTVDNPVVLPTHTNVRLLIGAADVIHSWSVPAFGVKLDAVPGRVNETWVNIDKEGTFYGQCSQLCGQGHGYMPIEVKAVSKADFAAWVHSQHGKMPAEIAAEKAAAKPAQAATADKSGTKPGAKPDEKLGAKPDAKSDKKAKTGTGGDAPDAKTGAKAGE